VNFLDVLNMLKNQKGLNNHSLSIATGIPYTTIDGWYKKGYDRIKLTTLKTLCQYFNVSLDFLIDGEDGTQKAPASAEAIHIDNTMKKYAQLDEFGKRAVAAVTDVEYERCSAAPAVEAQRRKYRTIDLYALPASAGTGTFLDSDEREPIEIPDIPEYARVTFAVAVSGDSMYPVYENGDYLLVEGRLSVEDGDIGVFVLNGESYVKTFRRVDGEMPWLESVNQMYGPIYIKSYDKIICCGKVIGKL